MAASVAMGALRVAATRASCGWRCHSASGWMMRRGSTVRGGDPGVGGPCRSNTVEGLRLTFARPNRAGGRACKGAGGDSLGLGDYRVEAVVEGTRAPSAGEVSMVTQVAHIVGHLDGEVAVRPGPAGHECMHTMHACILCMHAYYACMHTMHACILCMHAY